MGETELCFPQLFNTSCWKPKRPLSEAVLIYSVLSFISLLTASLNLLVIISISHFKQLHTPTNLLLLSLAVSDFFVGLIMPFLIVQTNGCWFLGDLVCVIYTVVNCLIVSASVGTMVLISVDRYVAICDPFHYSTKVTVTRVSVCISLCWSFSFLFNILLLKDNFKKAGRYNSCHGECVVVVSYTVGVVDLFMTFVCPFTVIIVMYVRVFVVAVSQARAMRSQIKTFQGAVTVRAKSSELKATKTLGGVVLAFLSCCAPFYISSLLGQSSSAGFTSIPIESWLFCLNSCLNPMIYAFCYPWFLKSAKLVVTCKILKSDSSDIRIL
ncbi:trace amine-associated receptor 13c-like [Salarias fasciatus]|uniref:Trace amine-associated receptor 13c-like n=1 Tax=Salarias fasciatus TaxID=181472 RepID=A0A672HVF9_SALFA|nr:trace amine-associated receptor 13c-like [Salarias fasciatus]